VLYEESDIAGKQEVAHVGDEKGLLDKLTKEEILD